MRFSIRKWTRKVILFYILNVTKKKKTISFTEMCDFLFSENTFFATKTLRFMHAVPQCMQNFLPSGGILLETGVFFLWRLPQLQGNGIELWFSCPKTFLVGPGIITYFFSIKCKYTRALVIAAVNEGGEGEKSAPHI